jgi:hypothetical protein
MKNVTVATALLLCVAAEVAAQNVTIGSPGSYTLGQDSVSSSVYNVYINASDVTLDLNGKRVRCAPSNPATGVTIGIYVVSQSRITIKNGSISGCMFGINASYSTQLTLDGVDLSDNTYIGANLAYGSGNVVRRSKFNTIRGYVSEAYAIGINGIGANGIIEDNEFKEVYRQSGAAAGKTGEGVGVLLEPSATNVTIRNNTFTNTEIRPNTIAIWGADGATGTITGNTITNFAKGVQGAGPFAISGNIIRLTSAFTGSAALSVNAGTASGNTIIGYDVALHGSITDAGNTVQPIDDDPDPPPPAATLKVVFNGDSNTASTHVSGAQNWTTIAAAGLGFASVTNLATAEKYADGVLADVPSMASQGAHLCVVMVGTDDMAKAVQDGTAASSALTTYLQRMRSIVTGLRSGCARVLIMSPVMSLKARYFARLDAWADGLRTLCAELSVTFVDVFAHLKALSATLTAPQFDALYLSPGVDFYNLSAAGHARIADLIVKSGKLVP